MPLLPAFLKPLTLGALAATSLASCATTGTSPGDMTIAAHERAAAEASRLATEMASRPYPSSRGTSNQERARQYEASAAAHRGAARAAAAEASQSCGGPGELHQDPLAGLSVSKVAPIFEAEGGPASQYSRGYHPARLRGALITASLAGGLDRAAATAQLECERVRGQAWGDRGDLVRSPLAVHGARLKVTGQDGALQLEIRGASAEESGEILGRAARLVASPTWR